MSKVFTDVVAIALPVAGVLAEANLLRAFYREWKDEHKSRIRRRLRKGTIGTSHTVASQGRKGSTLITSAVLLATGFGGATYAQQEAAPSVSETKESAPKPELVGSAIGVQLNFDVTSAYFYRGIIQEDSGLITQPAARINFNLNDSSDFKVDGFVGTWNSFHGQKTGSQTRGDFTEYWYESDLYAGVTVTKDKLSLTTNYTILTSPNDAYETVQELGFTLAFDDSEWLKEWALKPYATLALEVGADASDGGDTDTGTYLELGIGPGFTFDASNTPITITFPVAVGLSLSNYYQDAAGNDDTFGFAQVGAKIAVPLGEPNRFGTWALNAGVSYLVLGDHTSDYNGGDDSEVVGTIGVQWNF